MLKVVCKAPGCSRLVDPRMGKYCIEHQALEARDRERRAIMYSTPNHGQWDEMYNSPRWKALRAQKLKEKPFCEMCGNTATQVHHIIPHRGDWELFLDPTNLMSICHECHMKETKREVEERRKQRAMQKRKLWY